MKKRLAFRGWFYFRVGWSTYFALIFAAINTMVTTYYLAIKDVPLLKTIFPSFAIYVSIITLIGIPLLVVIGYLHYKRSQGYSAEAEISAESNPFFYKLPPGFNQQTIFPLYLTLVNLLVKLSNNEKITEEESMEIQRIKKELDILIQGGVVGKPRAKTNLDQNKLEKEDYSGPSTKN